MKTLTTAPSFRSKPRLHGMLHKRHAGVADHRSGSTKSPGAAVGVFVIVLGGMADAVCAGDEFQYSIQFGDR